jgi:catechol 2,3-dioxygenase-like lactoylglutathione lyase family enzyme
MSFSITRRHALGILAATPWAVSKAADSPLNFTALDHVEFFASDVVKSTAFYASVFGSTVLKNNKTTRRYVKLGWSYIAIETAGQAGIHIDHFCAGAPGFKVADVHTFLEAQGIAYKDYPSGRDLAVTDPDGTRLQLASDNGWNLLLGGTASPETTPITGDPIFRPVGLDHILLNVTEPERSAEFFAKILGPVTQRNNNRIWFQAGKSRIGLLKVPDGQRPGVNHYCVSAEPFDYADAIRCLAQAGAKIETPDDAGAPSFAILMGTFYKSSFATRMWRTHSCVPCRDSSRHLGRAQQFSGRRESLDAARTSACAT